MGSGRALGYTSGASRLHVDSDVPPPVECVVRQHLSGGFKQFRIPYLLEAAGTKRMGPKYIFVTGGVVSSLGKGVAAASIGCLLESRGLRVTLQKCDPYLNVDPGTMSPYQHGEVYVTDDGAETDLDLGHYERFTHAKLTRENN